MDLSHMVGLWLVGQGPGVAPGGVGVVYMPPGSVGGGTEKARGVGVYPFSTGGVRMSEVGGGDHGGDAQSHGLGAGVALIGELEYGADGLDGFVPRLWSAVNVPWGGEGRGVHAKAQRRGGETEEVEGADGIAAASHAGEGGAVVDGAAAHSRPLASCVAPGDGVMIAAGVNRGAGSIGLSDKLQFVDRFDREGVLGRARVVGFVEHDGEIVQTYEDVAVASFPVMFGKLNDYLRFAVGAQVAGNGYDDLAGVLARCGRPTHAVVIVGVSPPEGGAESVGSGVVQGDVCHSVVYDGAVVTRDEIAEALRSGDAETVLEREGVSWLRRVVEG